MAVHLGIDLGTSGCRCLALSPADGILADARRSLPHPERKDGASRQDPHLWWMALEATVREVVDRLGPSTVTAVAVDATSATVLACDEQGQPLGPALLYDDTTCRSEAERVARMAPSDSAALGPSAGAAKLLRLRELHPDAAHLLSQADWLTGRLLGRQGYGDENNALKLGLDPLRRRWPLWLSELGVPVPRLPTPRAPGTTLGTMDAGVAESLGLTAQTRVVAGTTDSVAAFIATGARLPGEAVTSLGSTLVLKVVSERPIFAPGLGVYSHRLGERWLAGGASNTGGAVLLQHFSLAELEHLTSQLRPEVPTGLDYYPLPRPGERFPLNDPDLAPRVGPHPGDDVRFLQGLLEGIARVELTGYRLLAKLGAPYPRSVRTAGGGAANPAWQRIRARLLGVPMLPATHHEAAYGAALLARRGAMP